MSSFRNFGRFSRYFSTKKKPKRAVQVCILGACTPAGRLTSLLLHQNPLISVLKLQGTSRVESMAFDFSHFDTTGKVESYYDMESVPKSIKSADIIVMMGLNVSKAKLSTSKLVMAEGLRVQKLAEACTTFAPKAIIVVSVAPVCVTLPIVAEVFKKTDWYHPGRLLGSAGIAQIKANAIAGHYQNLDPRIIHVPVVGGPDLDCALPLFTQTAPVGMARKDADRLMKLFREEIPTPEASQAYGLNRLVAAVARGLCGGGKDVTSAFVRTNIIATCKHMVSTIKMGKGGVIHNYGLQKLNRSELTAFENIAMLIKEREQMASDVVNRKSKNALPAFLEREMETERIFKQGIIR